MTLVITMTTLKWLGLPFVTLFIAGFIGRDACSSCYPQTRKWGKVAFVSGAFLLTAWCASMIILGIQT